MTIFTDNIGNRFLGDCIYANHNIFYPNTQILRSHPVSAFSTGLSQLCVNAGLQHRNIVPQANIDSNISGSVLAFSAFDDIIDDRYVFGSNLIWNNGSGGSSSLVGLYNDLGFPGTGNTAPTVSANLQCALGNNGVAPLPQYNSGSQSAFLEYPVVSNIYDIPQVIAVSDGSSLAIAIYQYRFDQNLVRFTFMYAGTLGEVNPNLNYYSFNHITRSILFTFSGSVFLTGVTPLPTIRGGHSIENNPRETLVTGKAQYPIVCSDGQNPSTQWATQMYVFDSNTSIGQPSIGRVRNLLLAQGSYTLGKPVRITGQTFPDNGFNRWLPVGIYAGKVLLMRCYSSVAL